MTTRIMNAEYLATDDRLGMFHTHLRQLARIWELEAQALDAVRFEWAPGTEQDALRDCASVYRKCAADLLEKASRAETLLAKPVDPL